MAGQLVVIWILGGTFVALLVLNMITAGGSSAAAGATPYRDARVGRDLS